MSRPIRPEEVVCTGIPDNVIDSFNELIQENIRGKQAVILQEEVIKRILSRYYEEPLVTRETIYVNVCCCCQICHYSPVFVQYRRVNDKSILYFNLHNTHTHRLILH